jgi:hypothetical protein
MAVIGRSMVDFQGRIWSPWSGEPAEKCIVKHEKMHSKARKKCIVEHEVSGHDFSRAEKAQNKWGL